MWIAWNLYTLLQSLAVPTACLFALFGPPSAWHQSPTDRFANQGIIAEAGLAFVAFETCDLFVMWLYDFLPKAFVVHHVVYIVLGLCIRGDCCFNWHAAILMAQEMSNPPLNAAAFLTNRWTHGRGLKCVQALRVLFVLNFAAFRLGLNSYAVVYYIWGARTFAPPYVPYWRVVFVGLAQVAGAVLQWMWGLKIARIVTSGRPLRGETNKVAIELMKGVERVSESKRG